MSKLTTKGFTDYFGDVVPIDVLKYDNNKYVEVRKPDGSTEEIKRGYVYADANLTRRIADVNWFVHGGGNRKNFKARHRKTTFTAFGPSIHQREFDAKSRAIAYACAQAKLSGGTVVVSSTRVSDGGVGYSAQYGFISLDCTPEGFAVQYGSGRRTQGQVPKYLRGHGKVIRHRRHRGAK